MSRILRRPMFRGGRVDARGTGITSNLGYAGGGSVNTPKRGLVDGPGGYQGWKPPVDAELLSQKDKVQNWLTPEYLEKQFRKHYHLDKDIDYIPDPAMMGMQGMTTTMYGGQPDIIEGSKFDITRNQILENPGNYDFLLNKWVADNYDKQITSQGEILEAVGDKDTELFTPRKLPGDTGEDLNGELTLAEQRSLLDQEYADKTAAFFEDQLSKGTPEEEIEKNKKIFQKAYGSGRADDASSMLLNFAGKALKPEATVKSAFGEFFEEEGKRPSESKKYKDAATTAAINAYLTGQKDYDSMMKQMKLIQYGNRDKITVASEAANLKGKDWESALSIVQDRYRGTKKRDSFLIVSETLKGVFGKPVDQKKGELGEIQEEDLIEGFTILTTKAGKIILEKIDGVIKKRPDLVI